MDSEAGIYLRSARTGEITVSEFGLIPFWERATLSHENHRPQNFA
jgi:hypothetical protein